MSAREFDAIVIGAGQAGVPLARALVESGRTTALIERVHVGGTCINEGCTPTKTMVASARVAYLARRGGDYGVETGPVAIDFGKVRQRKCAIVDSFRDGSERRLMAAGVALVKAEASFVDARRIRTTAGNGATETLASDLIFINTGARPMRPVLSGLEMTDALDSTSIMELDTVPDRLIVLGGGYIGLEFAQMFRRFGSDVTVVHRGAQLLTREDPDVARAVAQVLCEDGIEIVLEARALRVERVAGSGVRLDIESGGAARSIHGSHLLVAIGRAPSTEALSLTAAGVATDARGFIRVDGKLRTSASGIYALGDVKGGPAFTHISYDDFRIIRTNLLEGGDATTDGRLVPYTMYIDPQLGGIGLTETEARALGREIRVATMPMSSVARAIEMDETRGFMKVIVDAATQRILGCSVLGVEGGEIMSMLQIAMMGGLPYTALRDAVFAHPTLAEGLNNLFATIEQG